MTAPNAAPATEADPAGQPMPDHQAQQLIAEQIRLLYQNTPLAQVVTLMNGALLAVIQGTALGYQAVFPWFALLATVSLSRVALAAAYDRATPEHKLSAVWRNRYCFGAALAGAAWGASSFMLFTPDSFVHQIFLAFVLSGMMAGAIGIMASWFPAFALFATLTALPTVLRFAMVGEGMHIAMAWLTFLFMATMLVVAFRVNRAIVESLRLRFENQKLIDELEQRVAERTQELSRANEELEKFAYAASHDLQEPLRTVANFAGLLNTRYADRLDNDGREFIGYVVSGAHHMRKLVDDLLAYARVDAKASPAVDVDCNAIVSELRIDLKAAIEESGAVIDCEPLHPVHGNPGQIRQVFANLLSNAIKFRRDETPQIRIRSVREGERCIISVQDNGIGIPEKYRSRIFDMYERLHGSTRYPGTGMGLALCKKITGAHHGKIWVDSTEGHGSTFHFSLPAARGR
jgi:signal transduction histidine kinase